jgi:undecaprenyl-diphosphatase
VLLRPLLAGIAACLLLSVLFLLLADEVVGDRRDRLDRQLSNWVRSHAGQTTTRIMQVVTDLASAPVVIPVYLLMVTWLVRTHRRRAAIIVGVAWPLGQAMVAVIKVIVHRARPQLGPGMAIFHGYSFPSGHTFTAVETYGLLAALVAGVWMGKWRWAAWGAAALLTAAVGYSRVELGAHYPIDVLGSLLLGGAWLSAVLIALSIAGEREGEGVRSLATGSSPVPPPARHPPRDHPEQSSTDPSG